MPTTVLLIRGVVVWTALLGVAIVNTARRAKAFSLLDGLTARLTR